ncbi:hypothetical protein D3C80_1370630 [compost metagenome]
MDVEDDNMRVLLRRLMGVDLGFDTHNRLQDLGDRAGFTGTGRTDHRHVLAEETVAVDLKLYVRRYAQRTEREWRLDLV